MGDKGMMNNDFYQIDGDKDLLSAFLNQDSLKYPDMNVRSNDPYEENSFLSAFDYDSHNGAVELVYNQEKEKIGQATKFVEETPPDLKIDPAVKNEKSSSELGNEAGSNSDNEDMEDNDANVIRINEKLEIEQLKEPAEEDQESSGDKDQNSMEAESDGEEEFKKPKGTGNRKRGRSRQK